MIKIPDTLPLSGSDFFTLAMEQKIFRAKKQGNICRLVLQLSGHLKTEKLESELKKSGFYEWLSKVAWFRPFPLIAPLWRKKKGRSQVLIFEQTVPAPLQEHDPLPNFVRYHTPNPFTPPAFSFHLLHDPDDKTTLVFTWHHALMDARGAEMFLSFIGSESRNTSFPGEIAPPPYSLKKSFNLWMQLPTRAYAARKAVHTVAKACRPPLASLGEKQPLKKEGSNNPEHDLFLPIMFTEEETLSIEKNATTVGANFRHSIFYLAAMIRGLHAVLKKRGCIPKAYVVPVPQDTRKRGCPGPIVTNHLTFLFYRIEQNEVTSLTGVVQVLRNQMMDQMRSRTPESFSTTMELFRNLPLSFFAFQSAGATKGQIASFFFSCTGERCPEMDTFLDLPVKTVTHIPPASFPPGLSVLFSTRRGKLSAAFSITPECMSNEEFTLLKQSIQSDLLLHAKES